MLSTEPEGVNAGPPAPVQGAGELVQSAIELARRRFSCRSYRPEPLGEAQGSALQAHFSSLREGPFGAAVRFRLLAATPEDPDLLRGLGTYGFIKGATAFAVGAVGRGERDLEDYGYCMERGILGATALGLGTCWLGGSFTKSRFAKAVAAARDEGVPAVASVGWAAEGSENGVIRRRVRGHSRLPGAALFFEEEFGVALTDERAGPLAAALETVRLAPSASNKQPWRIVRRGGAWHFYLQRTPGYGRGTLMHTVLRLADLQRIDLGIAMCHFELAARELGVEGSWVLDDPRIRLPDARTEYVATWIAR
jgi:hypothetical protein